jgi:hypothetical protein
VVDILEEKVHGQNCLKGVYGRSGRLLRGPVGWTRAREHDELVPSIQSVALRRGEPKSADIFCRTRAWAPVPCELLRFPFWNFSRQKYSPLPKLERLVYSIPDRQKNLGFYFRAADEKSAI